MSNVLEAATAAAKVFVVAGALFLAWAVFIWQPGSTEVINPAPANQVVQQEQGTLSV